MNNQIPKWQDTSWNNVLHQSHTYIHIHYLHSHQLSKNFTHIFYAIQYENNVNWLDQTYPDAIDDKIEYSITLTNIYNPFKSWIIKSKHSPSTFKINSIQHISKFNLESNHPNILFVLKKLQKLIAIFSPSCINQSCNNGKLNIKILTK